MQLQQLYYFKAVVDHGSINKAAGALLVTQPNLSRSIQKLEEELGLTVFVRNNKGIKLTEEGRQLYQYVCGILNRLDIIKAMSNQDVPRILTVSAFPSLTTSHLLQELYKSYREEHIQFTLRETRMGEIIDDVYQLRSELGIIHINSTQQSQVRSLLKQKQLEFHSVGTDKWYAYLGPHSPFYRQETVSLRELLEYPILRFPDDYFSILTGYMSVDGESLQNRTKRTVFLNNEGAMLSLLRSTDAFTFGMSWNRDFYADLGIACKPIMDHEVEIALGWIKRKKEHLSPEAEYFLELFRKHYI